MRSAVLVADDEPSVRILVTEVLKEQRYSTIEAANGRLKVLHHRLCGKTPSLETAAGSEECRWVVKPFATEDPAKRMSNIVTGP